MVLGGLLEDEARQRQIELGRTHSSSGSAPLSTNLDEGGRSDGKAGRLLGVGHTYVSTAKSVLAKAPELKERIMNGDIKQLEAKRIELAGTRPNTNPDLTPKMAERGESRDIAGKLLGVN